MIPLLAAGVGAAANLAGGYMSSQSAKENAERNMYMQLAFARHGIKWKVKDAEEAGIHPLYALGAQTHSYSPQTVGDTSMGTALSNSGQDISRALMATRTSEEKVGAYDTAVRALTLKRMGLENDLLASKIRTTNQAGQPPGLPGVLAGQPGEADVLKHEMQTPEATPYTLGGVNYQPSPRFSNAQTLEDRLGEFADLFGPLIWAADAAHNAGWNEQSWKDGLMGHYIKLLSRYKPLRRFYQERR